MIINSLDGRLGNQLFQYSFALCLSKELKCVYIIDEKTTNDVVRKYFGVISFTDNNFVRRILILLKYLKIFKEIKQDVIECNDETIKLVENYSHYYGCFQSTDFFFKNNLLIKQKYIVKQKYVNEFKLKYNNLFKNKTLVIHYRIGDFKIFGGTEIGGINLCLPDVYYQNALKLIENKEDYEVVVVTDDIESAKDKLPEIKNKTIISDSEINDFQLLMHADVLIISNSTFAWWGAYLNHKNAKIFAPEYWLGFKIKKEFPFNIIPDNFVKVSFDC